MSGLKVPNIDLDASTVTILAVAGVVGFLLWSKLPSAGEVAGGAADLVGGVLSGKNVVTESARTDAYSGAGVVGTLGAAVDNVSGGIFSRAGERLGGWVFDLTH